jgi:hypothetical protein
MLFLFLNVWIYLIHVQFFSPTIDKTSQQVAQIFTRWPAEQKCCAAEAKKISYFVFSEDNAKSVYCVVGF